MKQKKKKKRNNRLITILFFLIVLCIIFTIAPNYKKEEKRAFTILYQNEDRTAELQQKEKIQEEVYLSLEDMQYLFKQEAYMDESNQWIVMTSDTKVIAFHLTKPIMKINSVEIENETPIIQENGYYYIPLSLVEQVTNTEIHYVEATNSVIIDAKDKELIRADAKRKIKVKQEKKTFSNTVDTIQKGESVVWISEENGWAKIRTAKGNIGYVKQKNLTNFYTVRENMEKVAEEQETTEITSIKELKKIKTIQLTDIKDYEAREETIEKIVDQCVLQQVSILSFENQSLQEQNETSYHRFMKELEANLAEVGIKLKS